MKNEISNNTIITIGRQLGTAGKDIGKRLADSLGIAFYDKELISETAKESGLSENLFESIDEKPTNSFLYSLAMGIQTGGGLYYHYNDVLNSDNIFKIQSDVIKNIAVTKSCVIVGRCADYVLRDFPNLIKVFIHADLEFRKEVLMKNHNISEKEAASLIHKADKNRANYYNFYTNNTWGDVQNYHIAIDSGALGIYSSVEILKKFIELRGNKHF